MSDIVPTERNVTPLTPLQVDDTVRNKIFITVEGEEIQLNYEELDLTFDSSERDIMNKIVPIVREEKGIDISDSYKVRKATTNENIFVIPASTAG